jgi:long-chain acyl-CoA synthetase
MASKMTQVFKEKGDTWPQILQYNCREYGDGRIAMRYKHNGIWRPCTWKDYYTNVKHLALGLLSLGFEPGDKVLIIGDSAPQWYYAELAIQANRGVAVGMYSDLTPQEIKYIAQTSEARLAIVEDQEQVDKLLHIKDELPRVNRIIYWDYKGLVRYDNAILMGYKQILQLGEKHEQDHPGTFEQNLKTGSADDVCAIVYTSGTTGDAPKGAVHTHGTMKASADFCLKLDPWSGKDNIVPSLPPAWITEQWIAIGCHLLSAAILNFFEKPETQRQDTREIGPDVVFYGARLWENQAREVQARILEASALNRAAFRLLMPIGYRMAALKHGKQKPGLLWRALYALADIALFRRLRDSLGLSNARICCNTGSILSPDALRFYHALNIPVKNLYGTTEGGALSGSKNDDMRLDIIGSVHEGAEVRITESGEIIYRHPGIFVGYYKDPAKTAEVLRDGWFYSGDGGSISEDGHIVFLDRVKDLVELSNGHKLAPQLLESRLRFSPFIKDAWVVAGGNRTYASAIIVIDYDTVGPWAGQKKLVYHSFAELSQKLEVYRLVRSYIHKVNLDLPDGCRVKKYVNLHKEFDPEDGELTRTRKLKRGFLEERYRWLIHAIYDNKTEVSVEVDMNHRIGRTGIIGTPIRIQPVEGAN